MSDLHHKIGKMLKNLHVNGFGKISIPRLCERELAHVAKGEITKPGNRTLPIPALWSLHLHLEGKKRWHKSSQSIGKWFFLFLFIKRVQNWYLTGLYSKWTKQLLNLSVKLKTPEKIGCRKISIAPAEICGWKWIMVQILIALLNLRWCVIPQKWRRRLEWRSAFTEPFFLKLQVVV